MYSNKGSKSCGGKRRSDLHPVISCRVVSVGPSERPEGRALSFTPTAQDACVGHGP